MTLLCVTLNHRSAPVDLRERVAFAPAQLERALVELVALPEVGEALILSTCNRVEVYASGDPQRAPYAITRFLTGFHRLDEQALAPHLTFHLRDDAARHLFRVASSLDAIVVGEPQILGQVKDAYFRATGARAAGPTLTRAFHHAFRVAKRVRTETAIASAAVSVSYAGVELARKVFGDITGMTCVLVGAGDMGELAARHFVERGAQLVVCNRSIERAHRLAEGFGGVARELSELPRLLEEADVVLCSTSAPGFVLTRTMVQAAAKKRRYRPLLCIDIAVPRDIDPGIAELDAVYVYDVDDLTQVVEENLESRRAEAAAAERIVIDEVAAFARREREQLAVPTIKALRERLMAVADAEATKTLEVLGEHASDRQRRSVEAMARAIVNKILHGPVTRLKQEVPSGAPGGADLIAAARELFALEDAEVSPPTDPDDLIDMADVMSAFQDADAALGDERRVEERVRLALGVAEG